MSDAGKLDHFADGGELVADWLAMDVRTNLFEKSVAYETEERSGSPHPGPLPREREPRPPAYGEGRRAACSRGGARFLPLPEGEGRGEGEVVSPKQRTPQYIRAVLTHADYDAGKWKES